MSSYTLLVMSKVSLGCREAEMALQVLQIHIGDSIESESMCIYYLQVLEMLVEFHTALLLRLFLTKIIHVAWNYKSSSNLIFLMMMMCVMVMMMMMCAEDITVNTTAPFAAPAMEQLSHQIITFLACNV